MTTASELRKSHLATVATRPSKEALVSRAQKVLQDFAPSKEYAYAYAMLGAVVQNHMQQNQLIYAQLAPSTLAKVFKSRDRHLQRVVRGIMMPDSNQFNWMSTVLVELFKLGVIVTIDDTLLFVDLGSPELKTMPRLRGVDVEKAFDSVAAYYQAK
jgi:hypothetical protein